MTKDELIDYAEDEVIDDEPEMEPCTMCNGYASPLGTLGSRIYYRCECCGWEFAE